MQQRMGKNEQKKKEKKGENERNKERTLILIYMQKYRCIAMNVMNRGKRWQTAQTAAMPNGKG